MKYILCLMGLLFFIPIQAQESNRSTRLDKTINALRNQQSINVSDINTTHLIFSEKIKYVDIGSPFFVVDTIQTIVKLKHTGQALEQPQISTNSNLTVITQKGKFYSIPLRYVRDNEIFSYLVGKSQDCITAVQSENEQDKKYQQKLDALCQNFTNAQKNMFIASNKDNIRLNISGVYYKENHIAIKIIVSNNSAVDLDVDDILVRTKLKKRLAPDYIYQERIYTPVKICNKNYSIKGKTTEHMTLVFEKFTPNDNERLVIDVLEKNGGRSCTMAIPRKAMLSPGIVK